MSADSPFTSSELPVGQVTTMPTDGCGRNRPPRLRGTSTTTEDRCWSTRASATASSPAALSAVSSTVVRAVSSARTVTCPAPSRTTSVVGSGVSKVCMEGAPVRCGRCGSADPAPDLLATDAVAGDGDAAAADLEVDAASVEGVADRVDQPRVQRLPDGVGSLLGADL